MMSNGKKANLEGFGSLGQCGGGCKFRHVSFAMRQITCDNLRHDERQ